MQPKKTPLYNCHLELGAQMVDFAGWSMPVRYSGDKVEHMAVRQAAGIFDVSHMGEISLHGDRAALAADRLITNDVSNCAIGRAVYGGLLNEAGGFVDDVIAYKFSDQHIFICVNAGNRDKDFSWITHILSKEFPDVKVTNESDDWAQVAVQGPKAEDIIASLHGDWVRQIPRYGFKEDDGAVVARTGYTGEDGFEIYIRPQKAETVFKKILVAGKPFGLLPCGLGARDTLRLEAGMCLYGNDINDQITPLEAGINFAVKFGKKTPFIGEPALAKQKETGISKRLVGLEITGKGIARHDYKVLALDNQEIGVVTSGTMAPYLNRPIALAHLQKPYFEPGTKVQVDIRGQGVAAKVVKLPFYKASEKAK